MADKHSHEGTSASNISGGGSDAVLDINVKTLDSRIYNFQVEKDLPVSSFKEKIANDTGVPVGLQRLIYRGKVLKDDHVLSDYYLENGDTLHLVVRQQSQSPTASSFVDPNGNNGNQAGNVNSGAPRNHMGQISHSVVLGTLNVGDQGEGVVPDLSRVIGAVVNSFGLGGHITNVNTAPHFVLSTPAQHPQGNETDGTRGNVGGQNQEGNQAQTGQPVPGQPFQLPSSLLQIPLSPAAIPVASLHAPIPHSLNTLSEFMNRMEQALSRSGHQPNLSPTSNDNLAQLELPSNGQGLPTLEALSIVLRRVQRLLSGHAVAELSRIAGHLDQEGSSEPAIRAQIQAESIHGGLVMQHLGSLLLELGRVMMTLHMGQSTEESSVNAGPAVYISSSGPNPIMVQPFPLQTASLFGGPIPSSNPVSSGPVGIGSVPRNVNIHIHAVGSRGSNEAGVQGEHGNNTASGDSTGSASVRLIPMRNFFSAAVPSNPTGIAISGTAQPGVAVPQQPADSASVSSVVEDINSRFRAFASNRARGNRATSGEVQSAVQSLSSASVAGNNVNNRHESEAVVAGGGEQSMSLPQFVPKGDGEKAESDNLRSNDDPKSISSLKDTQNYVAGGSSSSLSGDPSVPSENALGSSEQLDLPEGAKAVPLGLGQGSLERKKRNRQPKTLVTSAGGGSGNAPLDTNLNLNPTSRAQQLLQSLASRSSGSQLNGVDLNNPPSVQLSMVERTVETRQPGGESTNGQLDTAGAMSQVLHSPELNGLLSGFSEQIGGGSPAVLRNMLQQFTQSPQIMNTVSQIAQQVDGQDLGDMLSGLGGGQGGGFDLSRMVQQMMPVVTRALGHGSATSQPFSAVEPEQQRQCRERSPPGAGSHDDENLQTEIQQVAQRIEHCDPPEDVFRAIVDTASQMSNATGHEDLADELCRDGELAREYLEILQSTMRQLLEGDGQGEI